MSTPAAVAFPAATLFQSLRTALASLFTAIFPSATSAPAWSLPRRIAFRFLSLYLLLCFAPAPLDHVPGLGPLFRPYGALLDALGVWVGTRVFRLPAVATESTGSGDTAEAWVLTFCFFTLAAVGTVIWSIAARRAREHARLDAVWHVWLRYVLGLMIVGYGVAKVWKVQFPSPGGDDLLEAYGESTPMHLLWTFMGASTAYTFFGGAAELLGGLLLFWRRTATLGALVVAGVMANVVMLNLCYDVPVKLYSTQLLVMAILVLAPDLQRLANVLVLDRGTEPRPGAAPPARWAAWTRRGVKGAFLGVSLWGAVQGAREGWKTWGDGAPVPAMSGIYDVESFTRNGEEVPPLMTDAKRWKRVVFNRYPYASFYGVNDARRSFKMENDEAKGSLSFSSRKNGEFTLTYTRPDPEHITLAGTYDGEAITLRLTRADDSKMELTHRGFHWVTESPPNW